MPGSFGNRISNNGGGQLTRRGSLGSGRFGARQQGVGAKNKSLVSSISSGSDNLMPGEQGVNKFKENTPWAKTRQSKNDWLSRGFSALTGGNQKIDNSVKQTTNQSEKGGKISKGLLEMNIKVDKDMKAGDVKYNHRSNSIVISEEDGIRQRELPKQIIKLARSSRQFRKVTGVGTITSGKERVLKNIFRHQGGAINKANRKLSSASNTRANSSRRKQQLGNLVSKKYKS